MSYNLRLVEYFISEFYQFEVTDLSHLAAPTFAFTVNGSEPRLFDEFEKRRRYLFHHSCIKHGEFSSSDDKSFFASFEVLTLEGDAVQGAIMLQVDRQLLQRVDVNYDLAQEDFDKFYNYLFKDYDHFI